jgi:hypothetical protein
VRHLPRGDQAAPGGVVGAHAPTRDTRKASRWVNSETMMVG